MYLKAWTLFSVILFANIYRQRHISSRYSTDSGFLPGKAKFPVLNILVFNRIFADNSLTPFKTGQEFAIITTFTEMSEKQTAGNTGLYNDAEHHASGCKNCKRKQPALFPSVSVSELLKRNYH